MSRLFVLVAGSLCVMGCIPREPNYEDPPDYPPSVEDVPNATYPMSRIIEVPEALVVGGDGGPNTERTELRVLIRDPNVDQTLVWRGWLDTVLDGAIGNGLFAGGEIPPNGSFEREHSFDITSQLGPGLTPGCHRIDLVVTSVDNLDPVTNRPRVTFDDSDPTQPVYLVGTGTWWVARGDSVEMTMCPIMRSP